MKFLNYLESTWEDFKEEINQENSTILIPVGCLEEHGPHLPLNCDCVIGEKICEYVAKKNRIILGPPVRYGISRTTQGFPGTLEIRIDTLRALIYDIIYSFASQGVKIIVLFTWHGGVSHSSILRESCIDVLEKIREEKNFPKELNIEQFNKLPHVYLLSGVRIFDEELKAEVLSLLDTEPYHAAELETSLMLYIAPELVKKEKLKDLKEFPEFPEGRIFMRGIPWLKKGLMGDASKATSEKGKKIFFMFANSLSERIMKYLK
ncbi:MAG: creatininase family protein [Promethearchaeota archaeon]